MSPSCMRKTLLVAVLAVAGLVNSSATIDIIPKAASNFSSVGQYISSKSGFDSPKVTPINRTSYEWWYFDVVSEDHQYNTVLNFLAAPIEGFVSGLPDSDILVGTVFLSTPDQPLSAIYGLPASQALLVSEGNGVSGVWQGSGMQFYGSADLSTYRVDVNMPSLGVFGSVSFQSRAPAHYPSGPAGAGRSMEIIPGVGWANAIPDADAEVTFLINGTEVRFTGVGYHDKNWGTSPFLEHVGSWYWGHGRLGPYSIVWYDGTTPSGEEYVSGYVAKDGEIIYANNSGIVVRPIGTNTTFPPVLGDQPTGYSIKVDMGLNGVMEMETTVEVVFTGDSYFRGVGEIKGGMRGQMNYTGTALLEQFAFNTE